MYYEPVIRIHLKCINIIYRYIIYMYITHDDRLKLHLCYETIDVLRIEFFQ